MITTLTWLSRTIKVKINSNTRRLQKYKSKCFQLKAGRYLDEVLLTIGGSTTKFLLLKIFTPGIMTEKVYIGKVIKRIERSGPGGPITLCQLELLEEKRTLQRAVMGPVREGDLIMLLDCEREHRRGKF